MKTRFENGAVYSPMDLVNSFAPRLGILIALANEVLDSDREVRGQPMSLVVAEYVSELEGDWESAVQAMAEAEVKLEAHLPYSVRRQIAFWSVTLTLAAQDLLAWEEGTLTGDDARERVRRRLDSLRWSAMALGELAGEQAVADVRKEQREHREEMDAYLRQVKIIEPDEVDAPPLVHVGESLRRVLQRLDRIGDVPLCGKIFPESDRAAEGGDANP